MHSILFLFLLPYTTIFQALAVGYFGSLANFYTKQLEARVETRQVLVDDGDSIGNGSGLNLLLYGDLVIHVSCHSSLSHLQTIDKWLFISVLRKT